MRAFHDLSIRYKLTLLLLGVVAIVLLAVSLANVTSQVQSSRAMMKSEYVTLARVVAAQSSAALSIADIDPSGAEDVLDDLAMDPSIRFAALYNTDGAEVARYLSEGGVRPSRLLVTDPHARFTPTGFLDVVEEVVLRDGTVVGRLYLRAATDAVNARIRRTVMIAATVFSFALAGAFLLSLGLQRFISAPILQLAELAQRVSREHDYSLRASKRGNNELGTLCDGFNTMLDEVRRRDIELEHHRTHLEKLVEERTEVLQVRTEELTRLNADLERSKFALEAANKELEAFSYSISHDLRAPLRAIDGFSRIVLQEYADSLPADGQEYLRDVRSSTRQMGQLVDDLLAFSRLSRQPLKQQPVPLDQLVRDCWNELRGEHQERQIELRIGELPTCPADPALLKQVWMNLLSNGIKYTMRRERALIEVGSRDGGDPATRTYFVRDNGVGFDMRYAHKLFGVFQRLHKAEDYPGTGVGLAIVQRIVQRHGGRIWAESEPQRGTTFYFTLSEGITQ